MLALYGTMALSISPAFTQVNIWQLLFVVVAVKGPLLKEENQQTIKSILPVLFASTRHFTPAKHIV